MAEKCWESLALLQHLLNQLISKDVRGGFIISVLTGGRLRCREMGGLVWETMGLGQSWKRARVFHAILQPPASPTREPKLLGHLAVPGGGSGGMPCLGEALSTKMIGGKSSAGGGAALLVALPGAQSTPRRSWAVFTMSSSQTHLTHHQHGLQHIPFPPSSINQGFQRSCSCCQ